MNIVEEQMALPSVAEEEIKKEGLSLRWCGVAALLLVVLFFALIRFRLRDMPMERDEGEYAYSGQLMLQGIPPYRLAYNMKFPGTYAAYSVAMAVFGQSPRGIRDGLILVNIATIFLVYFLARRLAGELAGTVAGVSYALLSTSNSVLGFSAHATHFVVLFAIAGILVLLSAIERRRSVLFFWSGVLLGLGVLMKQPGILFVPFAGLYFLEKELKAGRDWPGIARRGGALALGAMFPVAVTFLILYRAGVWKEFYFWTFQYARQYAGGLTLRQGGYLFLNAIPDVTRDSRIIWVIAGLGLVLLVCSRKTHASAFAGRFFLFSFLAVCPGLYFRQHYFVLLLPALALLVGMAVSFTTDRLRAGKANRSLALLPLLLFALAFGYSVVQQRAVYFQMDPVAVCRSIYGINPFPEAIQVAEYIRNHTPRDARIAVLGSEPEIYFYSHRHSATGYIYTYGLMEIQKFALRMQKEMAAEIENARPEYMVFVNETPSWCPSSHSETYIFSWARDYLKGYELDGIVDIAANANSVYAWGEAARSYKPRSPFNLLIFKRRPDLAR